MTLTGHTIAMVPQLVALALTVTTHQPKQVKCITVPLKQHSDGVFIEEIRIFTTVSSY